MWFNQPRLVKISTLEMMSGRSAQARELGKRKMNYAKTFSTMTPSLLLWRKLAASTGAHVYEWDIQALANCRRKYITKGGDFRGKIIFCCWKLSKNVEVSEKISRFGLAHLFNGISRLYGPFNAEINFICKYLIVIILITIFNVCIVYVMALFLFVNNYLLEHNYMI